MKLWSGDTATSCDTGAQAGDLDPRTGQLRYVPWGMGQSTCLLGQHEVHQCLSLPVTTSNTTGFSLCGPGILVTVNRTGNDRVE